MKRRIWPDLVRIMLPFLLLAALAWGASMAGREDGRASRASSPLAIAEGLSPADLSDEMLGFAPPERFPAVVERDLFAGDRHAPPRRDRGGASSPRLGRPAPKAGDLVLVGVVEDRAGERRALIADRRRAGVTRVLARGDRVGGYEVVAVSPLEVTLRQAGREVRLRLGFRSDGGGGGGAGAGAAGGVGTGGGVASRFRLRPGMKVPPSRSDPRLLYQPVRRDATGRPTPAAHQRGLKRRVRQWQRKLEDYGVAGGAAGPAVRDGADGASDGDDGS